MDLKPTEIAVVIILCIAALWLTMSISSLLQPGRKAQHNRKRIIEKLIHSFEDHPLTTAIICLVIISIIIAGGTR